MVDVAEAIGLEIPWGGPGDYYNAASRLLEVSANALDTLVDYGLDGCPERAYVAPGIPAYDCEQLVVYCAALTEDITSPLNPNTATGQRHKFGRINLVAFSIAITRDCVEQTDDNVPPSAAAEDAAARQILSDGRVLWETIYWRAKTNTLFGGDRCSVRKMTASHPEDPSGGVGGWIIQFTAEIDGYDPLGGS